MIDTQGTKIITPMAILCSKLAVFPKISSQTCAGRMLSFSPEAVPIGWTLILERYFFVRPTSTRTARPKPKCDQKSGILCSGKIPVASFGLLAWVEVGRTKKFLSWIKVHPMGTASGENESILPSQVWELIFWKSPIHSIKWPLGLKILLLVYVRLLGLSSWNSCVWAWCAK